MLFVVAVIAAVQCVVMASTVVVGIYNCGIFIVSKKNSSKKKERHCVDDDDDVGGSTVLMFLIFHCCCSAVVGVHHSIPRGDTHPTIPPLLLPLL